MISEKEKGGTKRKNTLDKKGQLVYTISRIHLEGGRMKAVPKEPPIKKWRI